MFKAGNGNKQFQHFCVKLPHTQVPLFTFFKLAPIIAIECKKHIRNRLLARNKLHGIAPQWVNFNYTFMAGLLLRNIPLNTRYLFGNLKTVGIFLGAARYL